MKKNIWKILGAIVVVLIVISFTLLQTRSTVTIQHVFNAPVEKVWTMWNDPESIKKWWGPTGYSCAVAQNDLKIGGRYFLGMQAPDGKISYNIGIYTEIDPMKKIVSKLSFADENGTPVPASHYGLPGNWAEEATVTVEFTAMDGKTQVQITESDIPTIMKLFAGLGWGQQFEKMDALLK